jgi:LytR cell envelope-related transcriptional attenuator
LGGKHEPPTHKSFYISLATSTVRAVLLAVAVVLGVVGITNAFPEGGDSPITAPPTAVDNTSPSPSPSSPTSPSPQQSPRPPRNVTVQVLNGAGITGLAADVSQVLQDAGYKTKVPGDGAHRAKTVIFYQAGSQAEAVALRDGLFEGAQVKPATQAAASDADLTVILGENGPAPTGA